MCDIDRMRAAAWSSITIMYRWRRRLCYTVMQLLIVIHPNLKLTTYSYTSYLTLQRTPQHTCTPLDSHFTLQQGLIQFGLAPLLALPARRCIMAVSAALGTLALTRSVASSLNLSPLPIFLRRGSESLLPWTTLGADGRWRKDCGS